MPSRSLKISLRISTATVLCFLSTACSNFKPSAAASVNQSNALSVVTASPTPAALATPVARPTATPVPSVCGQAPAYAQTAGYKTVNLELNPNDPAFFTDKIGWNNETGKDWYPGMWYEGPQDTSKLKVENGALKLINGASLETVQRLNQNTTGRTWQYGYFEADVLARNWTAFWMISYTYAQRVTFDPNNMLTYFSELDFFEGDEKLPKYLVSTVHRNTGNTGGVADTQNQGTSWNGISTQFMDTRHKVGALWLPDRVDIYLDHVKVNSIPTYDTAQQKHFLVLSSSLGGVTQGTPGTVNSTPNESWWYSVCVWQ